MQESGETSTPAPTPAPESCGSPQWKGDNFCDDDNNNAGCDYDGGNNLYQLIHKNPNLVKNVLYFTR